jgi:cytochrome c biogenesis protein CcmG/thiol:disulfide interchange protein DsbE
MSPRTRRRLLWGLVALVVAALGVGVEVGFREAGTQASASAVESPLLDRRAPGFDLARLDSGHVSLVELRGRIAVLNFWASWCVPCRKEALLLERASRRWMPRNVAVVGIANRDSLQAAREFRRKFRLSYPQVSDDRGGATAAAYGIVGIPATIVIDARGIVRATLFGQLQGSMLDDVLRAVTEGRTVSRLPFGPLRSSQ